MGVTLADLDRWDAGSVQAVADVADQRANANRAVGHDVVGIMTRLQWQGYSAVEARAAAERISSELLIHADECEQAGHIVRNAASDVASIKANWAALQRTADRWGIVIDTADGSLSWYEPEDPEDKAEMERRVNIVQAEIQDLLRRADSTDERLSSAVEGAISDMADALGTDHIESQEDARKTVEDALAGNHDAADQVKSVLDSIRPEQVSGAEPLTPLQAQVLSQMQAQQHGMSLSELTAAENRLGDDGTIIGDSWQLMSNPDVLFPKTELSPGALDNPENISAGSFGQLPTSVQAVLSSKGMSQFGEMSQLTNIVKDGSGNLRHGTELDRGMLNKATEMMSAETFHGTPMGGRGPATIANDGMPLALDVLATAGQDHQAVHGIVNDPNYAERFMRGSLTNEWGDDGKAVSDMFSWTGDPSHGPDAKLAAETASAYGGWVGRLEDELMTMEGNQTLGQVNPEAVQGLAYGLAPYIPDIADMSQGTHDGFNTVDADGDIENGSMPIAKGIFSVLSTDSEASDYFNGAAAREIAQSQLDYANGFKDGLPASENNRNLFDSMTVQGLMDSGIHSATNTSDMNDAAKNEAAYNAKKSAVEFGFAGLDAAGVPGMDLASKGLTEAIIGEAPKASWGDNPDLPNLALSDANRQVLNALADAGVTIDGLPDRFLAPVDPDNPDGPRRVLSFEEYNADVRDRLPISEYNDAVKAAITSTMGADIVRDINSEMTTRYDGVTDDVDPQ